MAEPKLKQYKSCADCYRYEFGTLRQENYCTNGFPLEKLDEPVHRRNMTLNDILSFEHKPKYGCSQKMYPNHPPFDRKEAYQVASDLIDRELEEFNNSSN